MKGYGRFRVMEGDDLIIRVYEHTDDPKLDPVVTFLCECKEEKYADIIAIALENECSGLRRGQSPQREDVIDREAIARALDRANTMLAMEGVAQESRQFMLDAIRSLTAQPSREGDSEKP